MIQQRLIKNNLECKKAMKYSREKNNLKFNLHDRKPFSFITGIS